MNDYELYKDFKTEEEVNKWAKDNYGEWLESLKRNEYSCDSNDIADLLYFYTGSMNLIFNRFLREDLLVDLDDEEIDDFSCKTNIINKEISKLELKENIIAWRYTNKKLFKRSFDNHKIKIGSVFTEKSFMSTTLLSKNLRGFALSKHYDTLLKIYIPKGTAGAYIDFENDGLNENEFLLPKGCKFKLKKKKYKLLLWPHYIYECEFVGIDNL